jgi:hypothetical protein
MHLIKYRIIMLFMVFVGFSNFTQASMNINWSSSVTISTVGSVTSSQVVSDANGNLVAMWVDSGGLKLAYSAAGTQVWSSFQTVSGTAPIFTPDIAINASGQGVLVYDNGASGVSCIPQFRPFSLSTTGITLGSASIGALPQYSMQQPPLVAIDSQGNFYVTIGLTSNVLGVYYQTVGSTTWTTTRNYVNSVQQINNPYALSLNSAGQGVVVSNNPSYGEYSNSLSGGIVSTYYQVTDKGTNSGQIGVLSGVDIQDNKVTMVNIQGENPNLWQIFFAPLGQITWNPSMTFIANTPLVQTASLPVFSSNTNGIGILAYGVPTDNILYAQIVMLPQQTVSQSTMMGFGSNPVVGVDSMGGGYAAWVGPEGNLYGGWLPNGFTNWQGVGVASNQLVASGSPSMAIRAMGQGAVIYPTASGLSSVFFSLATPAVVMQSALMQATQLMKPIGFLKGI